MIPSRWTIRVLGKIVLGLELIDIYIEYAQYDDLKEFLRAVNEEPTSLALIIVDNNLAFQEYEQALLALSLMHNNNGVFWGVIQSLSSRKMEEYRWLNKEGCLFSIPQEERARVFFTVKNWYQIDTHAERALLGKVVSNPLERRTIKHIHSILNTEFFRQRKKKEIHRRHRSSELDNTAEYRSDLVLNTLAQKGIDESTAYSVVHGISHQSFTEFIEKCWMTICAYEGLRKPIALA